MFLMCSVSCSLIGILLTGLLSAMRQRRLRQSHQHRQRLLIRAIRDLVLGNGRADVLLPEPVREKLS